LASERGASTAAQAGLAYLDYMNSTWMPEALWRGWSLAGRQLASVRLKVPIEKIATTTNHLEAFNGVLKRKFIYKMQKGRRRLRFDLLIFLLVKHILPEIFIRRKIENNYYSWLSTRFSSKMNAGLLAVTISKHESKLKVNDTRKDTEPSLFAWWPVESYDNVQDEVKYIVKNHRIGPFAWKDSYTLTTTCASSLEDIREPDHQRYTLFMNCYGWSTCSCPRFHKSGTACKHLWAFREVLLKLNPPYSFIFPNSHAVAAQIYSSLLPYLPEDIIPTPESTAPPSSSGSPPPPLTLPNMQPCDEDASAVELLDALTEKAPMFTNANNNDVVENPGVDEHSTSGDDSLERNDSSV
jgi:hypothetical protein